MRRKRRGHPEFRIDVPLFFLFLFDEWNNFEYNLAFSEFFTSFSIKMIGKFREKEKNTFSVGRAASVLLRLDKKVLVGVFFFDSGRLWPSTFWNSPWKQRRHNTFQQTHTKEKPFLCTFLVTNHTTAELDEIQNALLTDITFGSKISRIKMKNLQSNGEEEIRRSKEMCGFIMLHQFHRLFQQIPLQWFNWCAFSFVSVWLEIQYNRHKRRALAAI